jgi:hypothetical protein
MVTLLTIMSKLNSFGKSSKLAMFAFVLLRRVARSITFLVYFVLPGGSGNLSIFTIKLVYFIFDFP